MHDAFGMGGVERVGDLAASNRVPLSGGRPMMRYFSVAPSRNSMAMKG
jgi:hypothetical protein